MEVVGPKSKDSHLVIYGNVPVMKQQTGNVAKYNVSCRVPVNSHPNITTHGRVISVYNKTNTAIFYLSHLGGLGHKMCNT